MPDWTLIRREFHYEIHEGHVFLGSHVFSGVAAGACASLVYMTCTAPNSHRLITTVAASGLVTVNVYEAVRGVVGGTNVPLHNLLRTGPAVPAACTCRHTITSVSSMGNRIAQKLIPGALVAALGGSAEFVPEIHMRSGENYLIQMHNDTAGALDMGIELIIVHES